VFLDEVVQPEPEYPVDQTVSWKRTARRISFGMRTAQGSMAFTLLASVIETTRQRNVSPWPYIAEVIKQRRKGEPAPVLPEAQCGD